MRYVQSRTSRRAPSKRKISKKSFLFGALAIGILIACLLLFRPRAASQEVTTVEVPEVVASETPEPTETPPPQPVATFEEADVYASGSNAIVGFARRGVEEGVFTHVIVASLPGIDTSTHYYEGWLVKPGITEFFSTGEMFSREDGKFGLVWESSVDALDQDIYEYSRVIITREIRDGNADPSATHAASADFGN